MDSLFVLFHALKNTFTLDMIIELMIIIFSSKDIQFQNRLSMKIKKSQRVIRISYCISITDYFCLHVPGCDAL